MKFVFHKPKTLLNQLTGGVSGMIPGLDVKDKAPKVPSADTAQADVAKKAEEEARRLRAKERLRQGVQASLASGTSAGTFASTQSSKPSLLG